jgi:Protein of unknown function (DUF3293)
MEGFVLSGTEISAFKGSQIPRKTIEAYLSTEYQAQGDWPLALHIGKRNGRLADLYEDRRVMNAAVLTAWNPYSELRQPAENESAQLRLVQELDRLRLHHLPAQGADPAGKWEREDSRLVLGIPLAIATTLGTRFQQNGIVWAGADAVPLLVLLR